MSALCFYVCDRCKRQFVDTVRYRRGRQVLCYECAEVGEGAEKGKGGGE